MTGGDYDRQADIWGLGIILFMLASGGEMPFETTDSENIVAAVSAGKHNENLPAGFSD